MKIQEEIILAPLAQLRTALTNTFKARTDVFARRWEKDGKSGYMPAYFFDPYMYKAHRLKGGTFQNFNSKTYLPLTEEEITRHLEGQQLIGIYPLLEDNTSWFIAADFDEANWVEQCRTALNILNKKEIPAYLERSRSGSGGHIWIFFEKTYPAVTSRRIILQLLEEAGVISAFDKTSSFDRLFPNQDYLSGKGLGNLIALPFHGPSMEKGNSCFIDPETLYPYSDQAEFLDKVQRVSVTTLDQLYSHISGKSEVAVPGKSLLISIDSKIQMSRASMPLKLVNFLRDQLNFPNPEFYMKKNAGKSTWETKRYFSFIEDRHENVFVPKGIAGKLLRYCKENNIEYTLEDKRKKPQVVLFRFDAQLREYQIKAVEATRKKDIGIIVAPPGSGKTVTGLKIVTEKQQPALIVVHRKQLADQWAERIEAFLGIPAHEIGRIEGGRVKVGEKITIGTIQSLVKCLKKEGDKFREAFGTILVDECHHIPADSFRSTIGELNSIYLYGLTATPFRKYDDGKMIFAHLGETICEIKSQEITERKHARIVIRSTQLNIPFNPKTDRFETISKILVHDSSRNELILDDIKSELKKNKKVIVITERKEHIDTLNQYLKTEHETITLCGDDSESDRNSKWKQIKKGNYEAIITTGQYFGEGTDLSDAHCLFLVYPFSFEGKLIQYIGRVQRSEVTPIIYDYRDHHIEYLNKLFLKRNAYYRKIQKIPDLFDEPENHSEQEHLVIKIEKTIKIPIDDLEFRYGSIAFRYHVPEFKQELEFEIENFEVRPEFEVLKPYFAKHLNSKSISVEIFAEMEGNTIVAQLAKSNDIEKINREVVEGVRFRFIQTLSTGKGNYKNTLLDPKQVNEGTNGVYSSGEEILTEALKDISVKHYHNLRYLADKHEGSIMKLRFVLSPFSFVFLIAGKQNYHVILETLDTEEATYLWHFGNNKSELPNNLIQVDENLTTIRNKGRQEFLQDAPSNFSRVLHDYSDNRKGFVLWKDALEERLD